MMKKSIALAVMLAFAAAPLALAHDGHSSTEGTTIPGPNPHCWPDQNPHDYGIFRSASWEISVAGENRNGGVGLVGAGGARSHNIEDCDNHVVVQGLATPGDADFDGDFEYGVGGGFFPGGYWANEPICQNGYVDHHHSNVHVHDATYPLQAFHNGVSFSVGADPTPPTVVPIYDPVTGAQIGTECIDDNCICPGILDPDDWLKHCNHFCTLTPPSGNTNPSFGQPGGDGGYWVFMDCDVAVDGDPVGVSGICSATGHIYFPNTLW